MVVCVLLLRYGCLPQTDFVSQVDQVVTFSVRVIRTHIMHGGLCPIISLQKYSGRSVNDENGNETVR